VDSAIIEIQDRLLRAEKGGSFLSKVYARLGEDGGSVINSKVCSLGVDLGLGLDVVYDI
jgi:hypothetical protein